MIDAVIALVYHIYNVLNYLPWFFVFVHYMTKQENSSNTKSKMEKAISIRVGTRGSSLARKQADIFVHQLNSLSETITPELVIIETQGDWKSEHGETRLSAQAGGKGQFTSALENQLMKKEIDVAVHSLKDVPSDIHHDTDLQIFLKSANPCDVFVSSKAQSLDDLEHGAIVGTASLRRQALLKKYWPHLKVEIIRGNVPTRLEKMNKGQVDALILAAAGLERLELQSTISSYLDQNIFVPCGGQGIIGIQLRKDDHHLAKILDAISCKQTSVRAHFEREFLRLLGGSCHTPIGIHAQNTHANDWNIAVFTGDPEGTFDYGFDKTFQMTSQQDAYDAAMKAAQHLMQLISSTHCKALGFNPVI